MRISINIQPLLHSAKSGVGFYEDGIVNALQRIDNENEYCLEYFAPKQKTEKSQKAQKYCGRKAVQKPCTWFSATVYQMIWAFIPVSYRLFFGGNPDIVMFFNYHVPPFAGGKKVAVIYDTVIKDFPETVRFKTKMMLTLTLKRSLKRADKIITISEFSKQQIIHHFNIDEDKIEIIPCGVNRNVFKKIDDVQLIEQVKNKYGIKGSFFLYLGTLEPRKNIERLIEAYAGASADRPDFPKLVLSGGKGWLYESIFAKVNEYKLSDRVVFTGYVDDDDVPVLMNGAIAFCFPSLYEGFGMPPLEAMACGTPVMVSNCSSLPEVVADCGVLIDPYAIESIENALIKLHEDTLFRVELSKKGMEQSKKFSWEGSAEKLLRICRELNNG